MPIYLWEARTKKGESRKGEIEADDEAAVRAQLRRQNLKAGSIKKNLRICWKIFLFYNQG
jgi:Type II secretory pathway, component PulF